MSEFLKCDAPGCDHIETVEALDETMVGKPCPKCSANLLTQHDWDVYVAVFRPAMKAMHEAGLARPVTLEEAEANPKNIIRVNYHDGETTIRHRA